MAKKKRPTKVKICSREWKLEYHDKENGGCFATFGDDGKGIIRLGTKWKDSTYKTEVLLHEIVEAILTMDERRYKDPAGYVDDSRMLFVFDHAYLNEFVYKLVDALKSIGAINEVV